MPTKSADFSDEDVQRDASVPEYDLSGLVTELNELVRLKGVSLKPEELGNAHQLLGLPAYCAAPNPVQALYQDLRWVVSEGLSGEDQLSAAVILRLASPSLFQDDERPHLVEGRELALVRLLSWSREKISRERPMLLARIAFLLFQRAGYQRERLRPMLPSQTSESYTLHTVALYVDELTSQNCTYEYRFLLTRYNAAVRSFQCRILTGGRIDGRRLTCSRGIKGTLDPSQKAGWFTLRLDTGALPIGQPLDIAVKFPVEPLYSQNAVGIIVDRPLEQATIAVKGLKGHRTQRSETWRVPIEIVEASDILASKTQKAGLMGYAIPKIEYSGEVVFDNPEHGYVYGIIWTPTSDEEYGII